MSIRRRLFVAALVIGGGTLAFQPLMRQRIESRLSELLGANVNIGKSKISLANGVITLSDVEVNPGVSMRHDHRSDTFRTASFTRVDHVALKFDWHAAAYRNLVIDNLLADGVQWTLSTPSNRDIPIAHAASVQHAWTKLMSGPDSAHAAFSVDQTLVPLNRKLANESTRHASIRDEIIRRLVLIEERLQEVLPVGSNPNPLRQRIGIDEVKREMAIVRQAIAEDRLRRKETDKAILQLKMETPSVLEKNLAASLETQSENLQAMAMSLATAAIARNWNAYRPLVYSALQSMNHLPRPGSSHFHPAREASADYVNAYPIEKMIASEVPHRITKISAARIRGQVNVENLSSFGRDALLAFELRLKTPSYGFAKATNSPSISMNFTSLDEQPSQEVSCNADQITDAPSGTTQLQVCLEQKKESGSTANARILQSSHGWSSTLQLPIEECLKEIEIDQAQSQGVGKSTSQRLIRAKLVGTTPRVEGQLSEIEIDIDRPSLQPVESLLATMCDKQRAAHQVQQAAKGSELLQVELSKLVREWDASGEKHAEAHRAWELQMSKLNEQVQAFDSLDLRVTRQNILLK